MVQIRYSFGLTSYVRKDHWSKGLLIFCGERRKRLIGEITLYYLNNINSWGEMETDMGSVGGCSVVLPTLIIEYSIILYIDILGLLLTEKGDENKCYIRTI